MAEWTQIPLGLKLYQPRSGAQSCERIVNLYAEVSEEGGKTRVTLHGSPGLVAWTTVGEGLIRGMHAFGDDVYVVVGETLYAVNAVTQAATEIGTVNGSGPVRMEDNGTHVVVCASVDAYAANRSEIIHLPEQYLCDVAYQDGYLLYVQRGTNKFWISGLDDATTIDGLDFTTADAFADNVVGIESNHRQVWIYKERSTEIYYNSGDATFPFQRNPSGFIERGCYATGTICKYGGANFWLGDDRRVYRADGYQPVPISTSAIDRRIAEAGGLGSAEAFIYTQEGHTFYSLSFGDLTVLYDIITGMWSERESADLGRWRAAHYAHLSSTSTHLVADVESNAIYELDLDTYDEDGDEIERTVQFPVSSATPHWTTDHGLEIDMETGVGIASGQGSAPVGMLDWSDDDGRTFGTEVTASLGAVGEYRTRVNYNRLGRYRSRIYRFKISDPVKTAILGAAARREVSAA